MFVPHHGISRRPLGGQPLIQPRENRDNLVILIMQPVDEFNREGIRKRRAIKIGEHHRRQFRFARAHTQQSIGDLICMLSRRITVDDPTGQPP